MQNDTNLPEEFKKSIEECAKLAHEGFFVYCDKTVVNFEGEPGKIMLLVLKMCTNCGLPILDQLEVQTKQQNSEVITIPNA